MKRPILSTLAMRKGTRGSIAAIVLILLVVLIGSGAFVLDLGNAYRVRGEMQNAADAAAMAAAAQLDGQVNGINQALTSATDPAYLSNHQYEDGTQLAIDPESDVVFGTWTRGFLDEEDTWHPSAFTPNPHDPIEAEDLPYLNAVQVTMRRDGSSEDNPPVANMLASILGIPDTKVATTAVAIGLGPGETYCGFPMVVSECLFEEEVSEGVCGQCLRFQDGGDTGDNAGWTVYADDWDPTVATTIINQACGNGQIDAQKRCNGACGTRAVDTNIQMYNGNGANSPCGAIQSLLLRPDEADPGRVVDMDHANPFRVTVAVIEGTDCPNVQFSGEARIVGFASVDIFAAKCSPSEDEGEYPRVDMTDPLNQEAYGSASCWNEGSEPGIYDPPPSDKWIGAIVQCDIREPAVVAGGGFFGLVAGRPRLVK